ncbi:MAG TPA: hypothetical protein VFJ43_12985 [Bacteroidia bacterium]|nr:hypothetical protein [Bacteroidia bacterium]
MKNLSLLIFLFLFGATTHLFSQTPSSADCKQFRTGTFYVKGMPNIIITRDETTQTETDPATGKYIKASITWTSDCTYELRMIKTNWKSQRKAWKKLKVLVVTITDTDDNSYQFSAASPALAQPIRGTIVKK